MTPEAQRIAIAEQLGWERGTPWGKASIRFAAPIGYRSRQWSTSNPDNAVTFPLDGRSLEQARLYYIGGLPDYLNDLNACHEMEKVGQSLVKGFWTAYNAALKLAGATQIVHATAAQRAEAFLRTIGKWID